MESKFNSEFQLNLIMEKYKNFKKCGFVAEITHDGGCMRIIGHISITDLLKNKWINIIKFGILLFFYFFTL